VECVHHEEYHRLKLWKRSNLFSEACIFTPIERWDDRDVLIPIRATFVVCAFLHAWTILCYIGDAFNAPSCYEASGGQIRKKGDERHGKAGYEGEAKGDAWHQFSPDRKATALVDAIFAPLWTTIMAVSCCFVGDKVLFAKRMNVRKTFIPFRNFVLQSILDVESYIRKWGH
jgi:hypothetical protein